MSDLPVSVLYERMVYQPCHPGCMIISTSASHTALVLIVLFTCATVPPQQDGRAALHVGGGQHHWRGGRRPLSRGLGRHPRPQRLPLTTPALPERQSGAFCDHGRPRNAPTYSTGESDAFPLRQRECEGHQDLPGVRGHG